MALAGITHPVFSGIPCSGRLTGTMDRLTATTLDIILSVHFMAATRGFGVAGVVMAAGVGAVGVMVAGVVA